MEEDEIIHPHELVKDNIYYYYHKEHPEYFSIQKFKRRINNKNLTAKFDVLRHNNCYYKNSSEFYYFTTTCSRIATEEEKLWFEHCEKIGRGISKEEFKSFK
jgi:hypothetical protein